MHEIFRFVYDTEFREKLQNHLRDSQLEKIELVPHVSEQLFFQFLEIKIIGQVEFLGRKQFQGNLVEDYLLKL